MNKIYANSSQIDAQILTGLKQLQSTLPIRFTKSSQDYHLIIRQDSEQDIQVRSEGRLVHICYNKTHHAFRALGAVAGKIRENKPIEPLSESQQFAMIGIMWDISRNAVPKVETVKEFINYFALMGINTIMLYAEVNYEIPDEPYWGHNIGKFTIEQIQELDEYAKNFGIELIPCIQTLAHLARALQWPAYAGIKDTQTVMMVDEEQTYTLIEKMFASVSEAFSTKRIHIGMDEAWDLGLGNYLKKHGYKKPYDLMKRHLARVMKLVDQFHFQPMMWSDMFFRAGSKTGEYYDETLEIPDEIKASIPKNLELVYWDYYHQDQKNYEFWIDTHLKLTDIDHLVMAPGVQTWNRFWANYPYALSTLDPALKACKEKQVNDVLITMWGDDGAEFNIYSMLPMLQHFAEHSYNQTIDKEKYLDNLVGSANIHFADWEKAGSLDTPEGLPNSFYHANISKALLWEDVLFGTVQPLLGKYKIKTHFEQIAKALDPSIQKKNLPYKQLQLAYQLAVVLSTKAELPSNIYNAYHKDNRAELISIAETVLPQLKKELKKLWRIHRDYWFDVNQPFGWETLETRYGGLLLRLETVIFHINSYIAGKEETIVELEGKRLPMKQLQENELPNLSYTEVYTATPRPIN